MVFITTAISGDTLTITATEVIIIKEILESSAVDLTDISTDLHI